MLNQKSDFVSAPLMLASLYFRPPSIYLACVQTLVSGTSVCTQATIFLASVHGKCLRYTEDVDVIFTKKNSSLLTLERG